MHGETILLMTFVLALVAAFAGGLVARALRLPPIVGYLLGGMVVSPFTPGFIGDSDAMNQLSEVGVMFMMFSTGLHFSLKDLFEVRGIAIPGAILQITAGTLAGYALAAAFGWSPEAGIMLGLSVSIASTVVLIKNLTDAGLYQSRGGKIATGWLIVEDLATVVILVVLPVVFGPGEVSGVELAWGLGEALVKTVAFVALMLVVGSRVLPWLLSRIARFCPSELFQLAVVVIALGTAMVASVFFDLSVALGAFLAGVVVSGSKLSHRVAAEAIPFKDLFSIIFFASVGMMVNPATLAAHLSGLIALVALIMVGKWAINMVLGMVLSAGLHTTLTVASGLSQIGEFSFIIGQTGIALGVLTPDQYSLILGGAVVSIALNSFTFMIIDPLESWISAHPRLAGLYERHVPSFAPPAETLADHVVVVGYGQAGQCVTEVLAQLEIPCLVVERDIDAADEADAAGLMVLQGDAANSSILEHAHLDRARLLVVAIDQEAAAELIVRAARELAPELVVVARADSDDCVAELVRLGASDVVRPELEGGIELMRHALLRLGYRPQQIQDYANDLRASGYEALAARVPLKRRLALERLVASLHELELHWVPVEEDSELAGRTLAESDLRVRTGAQVVARRRGGDVTLVMAPDELLRPGDVLGLLATPEGISAAERLAGVAGDAESEPGSTAEATAESGAASAAM
ncbi:cation:proton antiporter [Collinsella intestinalis]|uniref:cation:proton antiporter domain-containing protein n=1 Tax=Collinsella intestinalis TaxID=147207 RepID=UPI00195BE2DC|nr:cation:proton antiporter [Collinsella intestinalis]MBM6682712.1 cation:proton antiporter [Collinsella intestinalis]